MGYDRIEMGPPFNRPRSEASNAAAAPAPHPEAWSLARKALQEIACLRDVEAETLNALAAQALLHRVPSGSVLIEQGERPVFAQILLAGSIELLGVRDQLETLIELLLPVDLVIPAAVIGDQPYLMRARIYHEARLLLIPADIFRHAIASDHAFCRTILTRQAGQFRRQVRMQKNLKLRSAEERVGCYLVALLGESQTDVALPLPLEKRLIASQLGMTRETFSRALAAMAKYGMRLQGDVLRVEDAAVARARFPLDPLIDGPEPIKPLQDRNA
jgi:CRP/FNR family transcriptional activator FtrB